MDLKYEPILNWIQDLIKLSHAHETDLVWYLTLIKCLNLTHHRQKLVIKSQPLSTRSEITSCWFVSTVNSQQLSCLPILCITKRKLQETTTAAM